MALVTPIINNIPALDATQENTITFITGGGDQVTSNKIKVALNTEIYGYYYNTNFYEDSAHTIPITPQRQILYIDESNNKTYIWNASYIEVSSNTEYIIYENTVTSSNLSNTIPANTLINGRYYKVTVQTYNANGNSSEWSNYQPFYCYSTPDLSFNIFDGQIYPTFNLNLTLTYNQYEGEQLDNAIIYFYDARENLISSSGKLFNTNLPPVTFSYPLRNLQNNTTYKVKADVLTVDGVSATTGMVSFHVQYEISDTECKLYPIVESCEGYIDVKSAPILNIPQGYVEHNPQQLTYIDSNTKLDLTSVVGMLNLDDSYSPWVRWYNIYPVSSRFLFRMWFCPSRTSFEVARLVAQNGLMTLNTIHIRYQRGETEDYISVRTDDGIKIDRGLGGVCNGNSEIFLWLKVKDDKWDLQGEILSSPRTVLNWNNGSNNNVNYNLTTDITYGDESYGLFEPQNDNLNILVDDFNEVIIGDGIFDELILCLDTDMEYDSTMPNNDTSAVLFVRFNGSVENDVSFNYNKAILQKKDEATSTWWNLKIIDGIPIGEPIQIEYKDYFVPDGVKQTYGLIIYKQNIPSKTYTEDVVAKWGRVFLSDKNENYKLNYAVIYSNGSQNIQNGVLMPIGTKYPIVIQNAEGNYKSGSLQFKVLGYQFDIDKRLDRPSIVKQTNDILAFLTNGKPKCIKDYNGNIFICKVINSPQISYDANWGNGITTISFDWVEQAQYDNFNEMLEIGLIEPEDDFESGQIDPIGI